jgi:hypothetical protein
MPCEATFSSSSFCPTIIEPSTPISTANWNQMQLSEKRETAANHWRNGWL